MKKLLLIFTSLVLALSCSNKENEAVKAYGWTSWGNFANVEEMKSEFLKWKEHGLVGVCLNAGMDTAKIRTAAKVAKEVGLEYHAWAPTMLHDGCDSLWYTVNRNGESAYKPENRAYVTYYATLDPHNPEVVQYLVDKYAAIAEIEEVDYVQLDYVRYADVILSEGLWDKYKKTIEHEWRDAEGRVQEYPGADYCYCDACCADFLAKTGIDIKAEIAKGTDPATIKEWLQFRCDNVTALVGKIAEAVHARGKKLSADVFPGPASHAVKMVRQEWNKWDVDMFLPMNYNDFYLQPASWLYEITAEEVACTEKPILSGLFICREWKRKLELEDPEDSGLLPSEIAEAVSGAMKAGAYGVCIFTPNDMTEEHWVEFEKAINQKYSKEDKHFISDNNFMKKVRKDLEAKKKMLPKGDFFSILDCKDLNTYEKEALEFLYAYMPQSDIVDRSGAFFLENVRLTRQAIAQMPWGGQLDESLIRHFILPLRVNNEPLDDARRVFFHQLKNRVKGLSMTEAALEVNHWCHEKVVYTPSDGRTSSPLQSLRTAYGRCGEESTFCVAAMRSVGIPARQVYTPRWAHTDDNHAWVEVWVDGGWHFLGACEPEPVLDLGWFNAPASRSMLMHTKVFGNYDGAEEVMVRQMNFTEINVIDNYAKSARLDVKVVDAAGKPVSDALVEFKLYNYGEFYTVAKKQSDAQGRTFLSSGLGNLLVWVSKDGKYGFEKASFGKDKELTVTLNRNSGDVYELDIDMVPPPVHFDKPAVSPEQRAANDRMMAAEDEIRNAYVATMMDKPKAEAWAKAKGFDPKVVGPILERSRGNHPAIKTYLSGAADKALAVELLETLSQKDLRDVPADVIADHLLSSPRAEGMSDDTYFKYVLCPRVELEALTKYKPFFQKAISAKTAETYRHDPSKFVLWVKDNISINDELNATNVPVSPEGVWKSGVANKRSRGVFFVSVCRSLGIPSRLDPVTGKVQYLKDNQWIDADFEKGEAVSTAKGSVKLSYTPTKGMGNPRYYNQFTISRYEDGKLNLLDFTDGDTDLGEGSDLSSVSRGLSLDEGYYLLTTGTRQPDGSVLSHLSFFNVKEGETTDLALLLRSSDVGRQVIGSMDASLTYMLVKGNAAESLKSAGEGYYVAVVLGVNQEPTNHVLRDISALKADFEQWGRPLFLIFPDKEQLAKFRFQDFPALPNTVRFGLDNAVALQKAMAEGGQLGDPDQLPIVILANTDGKVYFSSQGYTIGMGEQLMKAVHNLK